MNYNSFGTNTSVTSPISTGTPIQTISPTFCVKQDLLELCCPTAGYQCKNLCFLFYFCEIKTFIDVKFQVESHFHLFHQLHLLQQVSDKFYNLKILKIFKIIAKKKPKTGRAMYGQFPWETIIFTSKQFYIAAGVLIDQYHVMSVAHRFDRFPAYVF